MLRIITLRRPGENTCFLCIKINLTAKNAKNAKGIRDANNFFIYFVFFGYRNFIGVLENVVRVHLGSSEVLFFRKHPARCSCHASAPV